MKELAVALPIVGPFMALFVGMYAYLNWISKDAGLVLRYGGAVLAGCILLAGSIPLISAFVRFAEPVPESLAEAGIPQEEGWSVEQANQAARITRAAMVRTYNIIDQADRTGDIPLVLSIYDQMLPLMAGWNMQGNSAAAAPHRACSLALVHLMDGAAHIVNGQRWILRDRYKNTVKDCG